ncbi:heat shock protein HspQ [Candidatus Sumerlaeota bacterium]|nr:heat shock protein HspQ [Candidatus Sumerlaeota bacterium]
MATPPPSEPFKFEVGQIVHHVRYDYRGVIFDRDPECHASEEWWMGNQSQPRRDQPWYHVLVDGAEHTTYVAESNLEPDPSGEPIRHPFLPQAFQSFVGGRYHADNLN